MQQHLKSKDKEIERLSTKLEDTERKLQIEQFGLERFGTNDKLIKYYTGLNKYATLKVFFNFVQPTAAIMRDPYYKTESETLSLAGRKKIIKLTDELFMFLCRIRLGLGEQDLSIRFNVSVSTVSRKIIAWANLLYLVLGHIPIWLSKDTIANLMPQTFKDLYPHTRVILDCTEIYTETPSALVLGSQFFSS